MWGIENKKIYLIIIIIEKAIIQSKYLQIRCRFFSIFLMIFHSFFSIFFFESTKFYLMNFKKGGTEQVFYSLEEEKEHDKRTKELNDAKKASNEGISVKVFFLYILNGCLFLYEFYWLIFIANFHFTIHLWQQRMMEELFLND